VPANPRSGSLDLSTCPLSDIIREAWTRRADFDLRGVAYGRAHWGDEGIISEPFPYYFFLAGMVNLTGSQRIVEVGTHQGGSARALAAGLTDPAASRIVTFDITTDGARMLADHPVIRAFSMDANSEAAFNVCIDAFGEARIDLAFIDSAHRHWPTMVSFALYGLMMQPSFVLLDDITLNPEMEKFWTQVKDHFGADALDVAEVLPEIRPAWDTHPGLGVVRTGRQRVRPR
jgi:hypothetical protein